MTGTMNQAFIIDPGSDTLKAGFSGDCIPSVVVPDLLGIKKVVTEKDTDTDKKNVKIEQNGKTPHEEQDVKRKRVHYSIHCPIKNGMIIEFDTLQKIVSHVYTDVYKVKSSDHPVFFTGLPVQPKITREKLIQMAFEDLEVPGFYIQDSASLSLVHTGLLNGIVVESGECVTTTGVVVDGILDRNSVPKTFYAGRDVTSSLYRLLKKKGYEFHAVDKRHIKDVKETLAFMSEDFERDLTIASSSAAYEQSYYLPSGETISVNEERFECCEGLFHPERLGVASPGIHYQIQRSLELADDSVRSLVGENIVLAGGNTMFNGFKERLKKEIDGLMMSDCMFAKIHDNINRKYAAWIGGSMITQLDTMREKWITKQEYEEEGLYLVERKCF